MTEKIAYAQSVPVSNDPYDESYIFSLPALAGDPANVVTRFGYDKANRLIWTVDGVGGVSRNAYDKNGNLIKTVRLATAANLANPGAPGFVQSSFDVATDYIYDAAGRRTHTINAVGGVTQYRYDASGNLTQQLEYAVSVTPPSSSLGFVFGPTVGNYSQANIQSALGAGADTHPLNRLTQFVYDGANRQVASVDALGGVIRTDYGVNSLITTRYALSINTSGLSASSRLQDLAPRIQASTEDRQTTQMLDAAGRTVLSIDPEGHATGTVYDGTGRVASQTAYAAPASGNQAVASPTLDRTTKYGYDAAGRMVTTTDAMQGVETYGYDALGNKVSFVNKNGSRWDYEYDTAGRLTRELSPEVFLTALSTDAAGKLIGNSALSVSARIETRMQYDAIGNLTARTEAPGRPEERTTRYEYDRVGRQIKTILPSVTIYSAAADNVLANGQSGTASRVESSAVLTTETRYDNFGNAVAGKDTAGNWSYKAYDRAGQLAFELDAEGFVTAYSRNRWNESISTVRYGERSTMAISAGATLSADDVRSHMSAKSHAQDREILTSYNKRGLAVQIEEPNAFNFDSATDSASWGRKTTLKAYNAFGEVISTTTSLGSARTAVSTSTYDKRGLVLDTTDALGYRTSYAYDSVGNLTRKVEFARTVVAAANTSAGDRITDYAYDRLNRKTAETRRSLDFTTYTASTGAIADQQGDVTTQYAYDAVGNLVCTTDALGGKTYSFYDALGRVRAVVSPPANTGASGNGSSTITAVTEYGRDAFGNVLQSTERATGALQLSLGGYVTAIDLARDRVSLTKYDARGLAQQTSDATGANRYFSYDASGQLAKEWQTVTVTNAAGTAGSQTLWRVYGYDKVGRQISVVQPLQKGSTGGLTRGETVTSFNAFGEVTLREVRDGSTVVSQEKYEYDNAGRVWRSNAGDGVTKVWAYNLQGQQTVQLVANGSIALETLADTQAALLRQSLSPNQFRRTDMQYDALGRLTKVMEPERVSDQAMSISTRQNLIYGTVSASATTNSGSPLNQVDLVWRSLENLGSGDVRITLGYTSGEYQVGDGRGQSEGFYTITPMPGQSISVTVSAEEAADGYVLKWNNIQNANYEASGRVQGVTSVQNIKVEKKDLFGNWKTLYDVAPPATQLTVNWTEAPSPGFIWSDSGDGRVPIYRLYNRYSDAHYFSTSSADRTSLLSQPGWLDEGVAGYVSEAPGAGLVAMYRLTKPNSDGSIYARESELTNLVAQGWTNRGIDGYVGDPAAQHTSGAHPLGMVRLYSLQNNLSLTTVDGIRRDGLYTTALSDRNALLGVNAPSVGQVNSRTPSVYIAATGLSIEVTYPQDLISETRLAYRPVGAGPEAWQTAPDSIQMAFGSAWRFNIGMLGLTPAAYEYKITNTSLGNTLVKDVGSGVFNVYGTGNPDQASVPALTGVQQATAKIDGTFYRTLQWPKPTSDWIVTFGYRPSGSIGEYTKRTEGNGLFSYGDGRTSGMGVGMQGVALNLGAGNFEYEVVAVHRTNGSKLKATGNLSIPTNTVASDSTPPVVSYSNGVSNLGIVGYVWTSPGPGRTPLYRYYMPYNNDHHITTADSSVIALFDSILAQQYANPAMPQYVYSEGIIGYVETYQSGTNERLFQYKYGDENIYRLTANPSDIGYYQTLYSPPSSLSPGVWYQSAYQFDGYISKVPVAGTTALYAVYDGNSFGPLSQGDYLTSTYEPEILAPWLLAASNSATAKVPGVRLSTAQISGQYFPVLQWNQPPADARVTVTASPAIPQRGNPATFFTQGDAYNSQFSGDSGQGIPLDTLVPGGTYTISVVVEYAASAGRSAYKARTDFTLTVPASGAAGVITQVDTTRAYSPTDSIVAGIPYNLTSRAISGREYDRWGNVIAVTDPKPADGTGAQKYRATYTYNANNQVVTQTQAQSFGDALSASTTYYDKLGRELGTRDGEGRLSVTKVYDAAGNLVQERNADGGRTDYGYNTFGERVRRAQVFDDSRTVVTNYSYDKAARLTATSLERAISRFTVTDTNGAVQGAQGGDVNNGVTLVRTEQTVLERNEYDEAGRRVRFINGADESTRYIHDRAGNIVASGQETALRPGDSSAQPASTLKYAVAYSYDAVGRKTSETDGNGLVQTWSYNSAMRLVGRGDQSGLVQYSYAYNLAGQLTHEENNAALKKSLDYRYDGAGQLTRIVDNFLGQTSTYGYDLAGNRTSERVTQKTLTAAGEIANVTYQDNLLFYDAQNRLRAVTDGRADVRIDYDRAGNRSRVQSRVLTQSGGSSLVPITGTGSTYYQYNYTAVTEKDHSSVTTFTYDVMNRQVTSQENRLNGTVVGELIESHNYVYDKAGNRIADNGVFIKGAGENGANVSGSYTYTYDDLRRLVSYSGYGIAERQTNQYDGAGRTTYSMSLVRRDNLWAEEHRYSQFDATGKLQDSRAVVRNDSTKNRMHVDDMRYHDTNGTNGTSTATDLGYDNAGNLKGYQQVSDGTAITTRYEYTHNGGYLQTRSATTRGGTTAVSNTWRDANGFISNIAEPSFGDLRMNRAFVNDAQGNALYINQAAGQGGRLQNLPGGYVGGFVGDATSPGHIQRQLIAGGQVLGRYGDAPDSLQTQASGGQVPQYAHTAEFELKAPSLSRESISTEPQRYSASGGESLRDIARNLLGDANLWWRIADANALAISADAPLVAGQSLLIPSQALNANSSETLKPYEPGKATGSLDPTLPMPANKDKCGGMGRNCIPCIKGITPCNGCLTRRRLTMDTN